MKPNKPTHTVMPHALAKALMEAGVQHFSFGGFLGDAVGGIASGGMSLQGKLLGDAAGPVGGLLGKGWDALSGHNSYQAQLAPIQTTDYGDMIKGSYNNANAGYGNAQDIQKQQQGLADTLLAQSRGEGPNPAQAALNQNTANNVANTTAMMASQRGAGANPALLARNAAQQGASTQQQAVGQEATMQAQQQLAAQRELQAQQQAMAQGNFTEQGINANLFGGAAGAQNAQNNSQIQNRAQANGINSGIASSNAQGLQKTIGGLMNGASSAASMMGGGGGGGGGMGAMAMLAYRGGSIPAHLHHIAKIYHPDFAASATDFRSGGPVPGKAEVKGNSIRNDVVPAMLSPGEAVLPRSVTQSSDAPEKAAEFVRHLQGREKSQKGYEAVASNKKSLKARVEQLEKLCMGGRV